MSKTVPQPDVMPVDREEWRKQLHLSNFVNAYSQYRDLQSLPSISNVLIIGPGQGLGTAVLKWRDYNVVTYDIDPVFQPDHLGSVHDMGVFETRSFDAVIASHVLEHLPLQYLDSALREMARVARFALIYLPVAGRHCSVRFQPGIKGIDISATLDLFNPLDRPDGVTPRYCGGQHYWEIGRRGFRTRDVIRRMDPYFQVERVYRNRDWVPSQNFVLKSRDPAPVSMQG